MSQRIITGVNCIGVGVLLLSCREKKRSLIRNGDHNFMTICPVIAEIQCISLTELVDEDQSQPH